MWLNAFFKRHSETVILHNNYEENNAKYIAFVHRFVMYEDALKKIYKDNKKIFIGNRQKVQKGIKKHTCL